MSANKVTSRLIRLLCLLPTISFADVNSYQNNQAQAIQSAKSRFDMNKIQEQQEQINQDNALAARIYDVTGIPSWRSLSFIRSSRTTQGVNAQVLIDQLDAYLLHNNHNRLTTNQKSKIIQFTQSIYLIH